MLSLFLVDCGWIICHPAIKNDSGLAIPQPTEWQRIGNQIDAAMIFARVELRKRASESIEPLAALA